MQRMTPLLLCLVLGFAAAGKANDSIRTVSGLEDAICNTNPVAKNFRVEATVTFNASPKDPAATMSNFAIADTSGCALLWCRDPSPLAPGDRIRCEGVIRCSSIRRENYAYVERYEILSHDPVPKPVKADAAAFNRRQYRHRVVSIEGMIVDSFQDEIDPRFHFLAIACEHDWVYAVFRNDGMEDPKSASLLGATVSVTGLCEVGQVCGSRRFINVQLTLSGSDDIRILRPAPADPFLVQPIDISSVDPSSLLAGSIRRGRLVGTVLAVWDGSRVLLRTENGMLSTIRCTSSDRPFVGDHVEAVGFPATDLYTLNLEHAIWQRCEARSSETDPAPESISAARLLTDERGAHKIDVTYHGRLVRLSGTVRNLPIVGGDGGRLVIGCDGFDVPVDLTSAPTTLNDIEIGCSIEATGVCVMETENVRPQLPFPHIDSVAIVPRTPSDIRILSYPPRHHLLRILVALAALLALVSAVLLWRMRMARITAKLRVGERTRLAVELHDSIAQNLTGVGLEINAAQISDDAVEARSHLTTAAQTLKSCRNELRSCIWDLRSNALEQNDVGEAIRKTLQPQAVDARIAIRFTVPRSRFTDNTAHTLLRVIRELVSNSLNHGHATSIKIAGSCENDKVFFSVQDNGTGFDPLNAPSIEQGHFGLQGIRERLEGLEGGMEIHSEAGKGTKVTAWIKSEC